MLTLCRAIVGFGSGMSKPFYCSHVSVCWPCWLLFCNRRFYGREGSLVKASVDGVDFRIVEPSPYSARWFSQKFKGLGLRYEVGIALGTGHIVWEHGPFPCGSFNELAIYWIGMKPALQNREKVLADGGYKDETSSFTSAGGNTGWGWARARHEAANKRLKQFQVLSHRFRHRQILHAPCLFAVANVKQILIENGEEIFNTN